MRRLFLLLCCMPLLVSPLLAAEPSPDVSWACWIVSYETFYIRCVPDSASAKWLQPQDAYAREIAAQFFARYDAGASREELENLFQLFSDSFDFADFWFIPIYNEPYETSWQEERPQQLVRAYLCPGDRACRVRFRH